MAMEWMEDLDTTIEEIDNQHKDLIKRIMLLLNACGEGKGSHEIGRFIGYLEDYVITHFSTEEKYMADFSYPGYEAHRAEHTNLTGEILDLREKFNKEGGSLQVVLDSIRSAVDLVAYHIRKTDKVMGSFIKTQVLPVSSHLPINRPSSAKERID